MNNYPLEKEFSKILYLYELLINSKGSSEVDEIFNNKYLGKYNDIWESHPYIFDEIDRKHIFAERF